VLTLLLLVSLICSTVVYPLRFSFKLLVSVSRLPLVDWAESGGTAELQLMRCSFLPYQGSLIWEAGEEFSIKED